MSPRAKKLASAEPELRAALSGMLGMMGPSLVLESVEPRRNGAALVLGCEDDRRITVEARDVRSLQLSWIAGSGSSIQIGTTYGEIRFAVSDTLMAKAMAAGRDVLERSTPEPS